MRGCRCCRRVNHNAGSGRPASAHERLKRLRDDGVLRGAHADVDPKALGIGLEVLFLIESSKHERGAVDRFMAEVVEIPEVRSAAPDLGIRVGVQSGVSQPSAC